MSQQLNEYWHTHTNMTVCCTPCLPHKMRSLIWQSGYDKKYCTAFFKQQQVLLKINHGKYLLHRTCLQISSVTISFGPNDNSTTRKHIQSRSPLFLDIKNVPNDVDAADRVWDLGLDILVDLTSHTSAGRIGITGTYV